MTFCTGEVELSFGNTEAEHRIYWKGTANERQPQLLFGLLFEDLLDQVQKPIVLDLCGLRHISSFTVVVFMRFLRDARARGLDIDVVYDVSSSWQCMTFEPLRQLSSGPVEVIDGTSAVPASAVACA